MNNSSTRKFLSRSFLAVGNDVQASFSELRPFQHRNGYKAIHWLPLAHSSFQNREGTRYLESLHRCIPREIGVAAGHPSHGLSNRSGYSTAIPRICRHLITLRVAFQPNSRSAFQCLPNIRQYPRRGADKFIRDRLTRCLCEGFNHLKLPLRRFTVLGYGSM